MSRRADREWVRTILLLVPLQIGLTWFAFNIVASGRVPLRYSTILRSDDPELFAVVATLFCLLTVFVVMVLPLWMIWSKRHSDANIDRRRSLPLDNAVRTPYQTTDMSDRPLVIAVDGPAASGKGTIAARLAAHYGLPHLDTGLLYRAVGLKLLIEGHSPDDAEAAEAAARSMIPAGLTEDVRLTTGEAGEAASRVASHPGVRAALLELQQDFASQHGGAVLDGRDIGTVIAPDAVAKLFITATPQVRARRRWLQLTARGDDIAFEDMLADIQRRDERDAGRGAAPMVMADDAVLLDTTDMDIEAAFDAARRIVEAARAS